MRLFALVFLLCQLVFSAHCLRNVTVDDNNPSIQYVGDWSRSTQTDLDYGGTHMLTTNASSRALFNFTGVAVYFMSPLWPYAVSTALTLDSQPTIVVDLTDHSTPNTAGGIETVRSNVVWSAQNLQNTTHSLRISVWRGQTFAVVDGITYTTLMPGESLPSNTSSNGDSDGDGRQAIIIVLAVLLGVLALLLLGLLLWLCLRRRDTSPSSRVKRTSAQSSGKQWGGNARSDDTSVAELDPVGSRSPPSGSPRNGQFNSPVIPPTAPHTSPPPSRPDSNYNPRETVWSTSSIGGPGIPNMTGVGASARTSRAVDYNHGDPRLSTSHFGASQGDLADAYDTGPYINPNRDPRYPSI
ncbi:hypothetical protein AN958_11890 [Leucoagaricus sp. SymC.cos]|nr:hypothetical protein AN958_11890 [Leucoagaricus sp. SymC.cos]